MTLTAVMAISSQITFAATPPEDECGLLRVGGGSWVANYPDSPSPSARASMDLLRQFSETTGMPYELGPGHAFPRQISQLKTGDTDIIFGLYIIPEREVFFDFSDIYYKEPLYAYTRASDGRDIRTLEDLDGLTGIVVRAVSYGPELDRLFAGKQSKLIKVNQHDQRLRMLLSNRADYFVSAEITQNQAYVDDGKLVRSKEPVSWVGIAAAFSKKSACRAKVTEMNAVIKSINLKTQP